jgi:hypothetical protein
MKILSEHSPDQIQIAKYVYELKKGLFIPSWWMRIYGIGFFSVWTNDFTILLYKTSVNVSPNFDPNKKNLKILSAVISSIMQNDITLDQYMFIGYKSCPFSEIQKLPSEKLQYYQTQITTAAKYCIAGNLPRNILLEKAAEQPIPLNIHQFLSQPYINLNRKKL